MTSPRTHFAALFDELVRRAPGALAILEPGRGELSRDGLAQAARAVERCLGVRGGGVIPIWVRRPAEVIVRTLAVWRTGGVPLLLDATLPFDRARALAAACGAEVWPATVSDAVVLEDLPPTGAAPAAECVLLKMTSGSTGDLRAVQLTASALEIGLANIATTMGRVEADRNLVTIPLTHSYGFDNVVLGLLGRGLAAVCVADPVPRAILAAARETLATVWPGVPAQLSALARMPADAGSAGSLRLVISAGAPLAKPVREAFATRFGLRPANFYGSTECGGICFDVPDGAPLAEGRVGRPLSGVRIRLDEPDHRGIGRVIVESGSVALGFHGSSATSDALLEPGRLRTGDLGWLDEAGRLHLAGRIDDQINIGGRKVHPGQVERVIREIEGIRDVAVLGITTPAGRSELWAWVETGDALSVERISAHCAKRLAPHERPRQVRIVAELPRDGRGKLDRNALRGAV